MFPRRRPAATICGFGLAVSVGLMALVAVRAEEAAVLFARACASCHGKDGKARTPIGRKLKVKDLTQSMIGDREIAEQIREGKKGQDDLTRMPSFKESLKGDEIEALVRYVKSLRARVPAKPGGGK